MATVHGGSAAVREPKPAASGGAAGAASPGLRLLEWLPTQIAQRHRYVGPVGRGWAKGQEMGRGEMGVEAAGGV